MNARLTTDERAELESLRRLTQEQAEELRAWREYDRSDDSVRFRTWAYGLRLAPSPARILDALLRVPGEPVSNDFLLQAIEPYRRDAMADHDPNIIKVYVHAIRKRLNDLGRPNAIATHPGFGYSLSPAAAAFLRPVQEKAA